MADENQMDQGLAVPPQAKEEPKRGETHVRKAAEDLRSAAGATTDEYLGRAEEVWDDALRRVRSFQGDREQYVRENHPKAVLTALAVGCLLGFTFHRQRQST